jgi:transposase
MCALYQLIVLRRSLHGRVRFTNHDRWFLIQLYRWFSSILQVLTVIQPETLVRWHCLVGIEACASSHYWSRELQALGHTVRLMPPAYVKPYVKRQKNEMADAEEDIAIRPRRIHRRIARSRAHLSR